MTCQGLTVDGYRAIVCGGRQRARSCQFCATTHTRLCDWKLRPGVTCDAPLCEEHAHVPSPGKDLCPRHAKQWAERQVQAELPL